MMVVAALLLGGCGMNRVHEVKDGGLRLPRRTTAVVGVDTSDWTRSDTVAVILTHVDTEGIRVGGGCFIHDRMSMTVKRGSHGVQLHAFTAPAGIYYAQVLGAPDCSAGGTCMLDDRLDGAPFRAFRVDKDQVNYTATFAVHDDGRLDVHRSLADVTGWVERRLERTPVLAQTVPGISMSRGYLCAP